MTTATNQSDRSRELGIAVTAALLAALAPSVVAAQTVERQQLEEIIVTANKRTESLSDVGMSITAITGDALQARGIESTTQLSKIVPGLTVQPSPFNTPVYTMRGVGFYETTLSAPPTVAVYVDEVQLPFSATTKGAAFDVERVEVLKGPQGTLFGQNTTGGAINFIANKPSDAYETGTKVAYERFGKGTIEAFLGGPITENLRGRLAVGTVQGGAWQRSFTRNDSLGDQNLFQGRGILEWAVSDDLDVKFTASGWRDKGETQAAQKIGETCGPPVPGDMSTCGSPDAQAFRDYPNAPDDARAADWGYGVFGRPLERDDKFYQANVRIDYRLNSELTLTSITAYSDYDTDSVQDFDGTSLKSVDTNTTGYIEDFSQEIRLAGLYDRMNFIVGANYSDTATLDRLFYNFSEGPSSNPLWMIPGAPRGDLTFNYSDQDITTAALFGNIEYSLSDAFKLVAGARYTDSQRDFKGCTNDWPGPSTTDVWWNTIFGTNVQDGGCLTFDPSFQPYDPALVDKLDEDNVSWNVGLNYSFGTDGLVYGRISQGYKAGSFPTASVASYNGYTPVKQESLLAYELGLKKAFLDNTLNMSAAAFFYDYQDKQLRGRSPDPVFGTLDALVQVPESEVKGLEFEMAALPFEGFRVSLGGTFIDTEVTKFEGYNALGQLLNFEGQEFPFAPEVSIVADAQYTFPLKEKLNAFVGIGATYNDETSSQLDNTDTQYVTADHRFDIDSYTVIDLRAGVESSDGTWRVMAYCYNCNDEFYWTNVQNNLASISRFVGMPRIYGLSVSWRN